MARSVYPYELDDPDFAWLLSRFREDHPEYALVDVATLPLVLVSIPELVSTSFVPALPLPPGYEDYAPDQEEGEYEP